MPKVPLHQLDPRILSAVADVEAARGVHPLLANRIQIIEGELIGARGIGYAAVGDRLNAMEALVGTSPRGTLMQNETHQAYMGQQQVQLPTTYDPLTSDLLVYRNGQLQHLDDDYTRTSSDALFTEPLFASEYVDFIWFALPNDSRYVRIDVTVAGSSFPLPTGLPAGAQVLVTLNRLLLTPGIDYSIGSDTLNLTQPAAVGKVIEIRALIFNGNSSGWTVQLTAVGGEVTFATPYAYLPSAHQLLVFQNGLLLTPVTDYTEVTAQTIQLGAPTIAGDSIYIVGSTRAFDRLASLEEQLRSQRVAGMRSEMRQDQLDARLATTPLAYSWGGVTAFTTPSGLVAIADFLQNLTPNPITTVLSLPAKPPAATEMYLVLAATGTSSVSQKSWIATATTVLVTVAADGIVAGWSVIYR